MTTDPFQNEQHLSIDFDTSYEEAEQWQGALRNEEDAEQIVREKGAVEARVRFFYLALGLIFLILLARLLTLQLFNAEQNKALAEGNRIRETDTRAPRGVIYDAKHNILARNVPNVEVTITPSELSRKADERAEVYQRLGTLINRPPADIKQLAESKGPRYAQQILVADKIDRNTSILLQMRAGNLSGVRVADNPQRQYGQAEQFAHLLGYTGRVSEDDLKRHPDFQPSDYVGKLGVEQTYEQDLRGQPGKQRVEVNAAGQALKELQSTDPTSGRNLVLSVDSDLQAVMVKAVENGIRSSKRAATGGSAIALNPKTGAVLGMVSIPSFDNNLFVNGIKENDYKELAENSRKPLFNRPISGEYPPGSTFKIVTVTGALAEGVISPSKYLASPPKITIQGYDFKDWNPSGHGSVNAEQAIAQSSDVYFYKVSGGFTDQRALGEDKLASYMRQFNIGEPSGIDLPGEHTGLVPTPKWKEDNYQEPWYIGNTYQMGIGQGYVLTTPIEVANYTAAIAGNGVAYQPHVVGAIENADNPNDRQIIAPKPLINLKASSDVIKVVQEGMRQAVRAGTAQDLRNLPVDICGKTGSAEFANETSAHAWFTAYAPCDDPQIVLTVMIEGGGEGSDVAVPAARTIFEHFFKVPPAKEKGKQP